MATPRKGRIFISYRRNDTSYAAGRIYDRLAAHFGEDAIFMDVEAIEGGLDFVNVLEEAVQSCDVLIALVGRQWINSKDEGGKRRLDNPEDFVRIEIATALFRDIRVIPVLVDGFHMPRSTELPENLKLFARRNALQVNHPSFNSDVNRLITHIELALKAVEESRILKAQAEKAKQEAAEQAAREKAAKVAAEKTAREMAEKETAEKAAQEKAKQEAAEKIAQEKKEREAARARAEREAAERVAKEKAERAAAERTAKEKAERAAAKKAARKAIWENFLQKVNTFLKAAPQSLGFLKLRKKTLIITALVSLVVIFILIGFIQLNNPPLYFSSFLEGEVNIYSYENDKLTRITQAPDGSVNLSPAVGFGSEVYFTSNRMGKGEIYGFDRTSGKLEQITHTDGQAESWSPEIDFWGTLYFTSNRTGKAEIYRFNRDTGELNQITHTPDPWESWMPAIDLGGDLYFTSNRTGKNEIFRFDTTSGELNQITHTDGQWESWSPAVDLGPRIYFTSNRTGKAEIYRFNTNTGELERLTNTPGNAESWSPVVLGNKIYITSNRSGQSRIYLLKEENNAITDFESWTKKLDDRNPGP